MRRQHREATAAGIGLGTTAKYMQQTTSGAAGNGLFTTIKYLRGAVGIGVGTTPQFFAAGALKPAVETCVDNTAELRPQASGLAQRMQRATSGAVGNGLYTTAKYMRGAAGISLGATTKSLRRKTSAAANNG